MNKQKWSLLVAVFAVLIFAVAVTRPRPQLKAATTSSSVAAQKPWKFAVSGDSRNCGNLVMPAIAQGAKVNDARFYLHLGDFRAMKAVDEDLMREEKFRGKAPELKDYQSLAWQDFIDNQISVFGKMPVYLVRGNHETYSKTREDYITAFRPWLEKPELQAARAQDAFPDSATSIYYHWKVGTVDFIMMDNAEPDQFEAAQMDWFHKVLDHDLKEDSGITTIVLGMHEALPDSISLGHSMSESVSPVAIDSGREVYQEMLKARDVAHKQVYILASHSHFFMEGTFNTPYWQEHGGVLPGWIVGTAGAQRIHLPKEADQATKAIEKVYGYLIGSVDPENGTIQFDFQQLQKSDIPQAVAEKYGSDFVDFCFDQNIR